MALEIRQENFERLLTWLDPDRDTAGHKYETIRERLIKIFYANRCQTAEEMADEAIDRVSRKVESLFERFEGEPALYFYGVARKLLLESTRRPKTTVLPVTLVSDELQDEDSDSNLECLDKCLERLALAQRELIIGYYEGSKREKIDRRKQMADRLEITAETLRVRALRIRMSVQKCMIACVANKIS